MDRIDIDKLAATAEMLQAVIGDDLRQLVGIVDNEYSLGVIHRVWMP